MRKCYETYNFAPIRSLIEEAQVLANRMEAALGDQKDIRKLSEDRSEKLKEYRKLFKEVEALKKLKEEMAPSSQPSETTEK